MPNSRDRSKMICRTQLPKYPIRWRGTSTRLSQSLKGHSSALVVIVIVVKWDKDRHNILLRNSHSLPQYSCCCYCWSLSLLRIQLASSFLRPTWISVLFFVIYLDLCLNLVIITHPHFITTSEDGKQTTKQELSSISVIYENKARMMILFYIF